MAWGVPTPTATKSPVESPEKIYATLESLEAAVAAEAKVDIFDSVTPVSKVRVDGLVLLSIMKHSNDPGCVTGSLLGLENDDTLEVTHAFPNPDPSAVDADTYQMEMMKSLREVNVDNNRVGWYQSIKHGAFCTLDVMEYQFQYQVNLGPNMIVLTYDSTTLDECPLKAFRLSPEFYKQYKNGNFQKNSTVKNAPVSSILEEIPITLYNTDLVNVWLSNVTNTSSGDDDNACLSKLGFKNSSSFIESRLSNLSAWTDELAAEHVKFQNYERQVSKSRAQYSSFVSRRKEQNVARAESGQELLPEEDPAMLKSLMSQASASAHPPSRLEVLLITKQISSYCDSLTKYSGKSFEKLFLLKSLHESE